MKKIHVAFIVVISMLYVACFPQKTTWIAPKIYYTTNTPVIMDVCIGSLPQKAKVGAKNAINSWNTALIQWRSVIAKDSESSNCSINVELVQYRPENKKDALAWVSSIGGKTMYIPIDTAENFSSKDFESIFAHELGHVFGAQHVNGTLMNSQLDSTMKCPDVITIAQVAAWNDINLDLLSWCVNY